MDNKSIAVYYNTNKKVKDQLEVVEDLGMNIFSNTYSQIEYPILVQLNDTVREIVKANLQKEFK